jgi:AcrR family transcriptional regulator
VSSQKREDILAAALRLVSKHGFHGASMAMIAAEAGSGAGTIYNYFPSKDALLDALFRQIKIEFIQAMLAGISDQDTYQTRFKRMWQNTIQYYLTYPEKIAYLQQFHYSPYVSSETERFVAESMAPILSLFEQAMAAGVLRPLPQPVLESLTLDVATSLARRHHQGEIQLTEALIQDTAEACWQALKAD